MKGTTFVGLDAHARTLQVAVLGSHLAKAVELSSLTDLTSVRRLAQQLKKHAAGGELRCCYEAGPTGFALQRQLEAAGVPCIVVAPSLIPRAAGDRIKTDRRDARKLAELLRADMVTPVRPPTLEEEAVRDLCRAREDAVQARTRCRHQLGKFLLRRGVRWVDGKCSWTRAHHAWLAKLRFELDVEQSVLDEYLHALEQADLRVDRLDAKLEAVAEGEVYRARVGWLRCLRGVKTVTAMTILSELHGFERFQSPRQLMAYLGLVPSEHSSGERRSRGGITKAGNSHVRRILIETAWQYRHRIVTGSDLRRRRLAQPARVIAIAEKAQARLGARYRKLTARGKHHNKVVTAIARELTGFVWAILSPAA